MPTEQMADCPVCGRNVAVRVDGSPVMHLDTSRLGGWVHNPWCPGGMPEGFERGGWWPSLLAKRDGPP